MIQCHVTACDDAYLECLARNAQALSRKCQEYIEKTRIKLSSITSLARTGIDETWRMRADDDKLETSVSHDFSGT